VDLIIGENENKFSISYPKDYPKSKEKMVIESFVITSSVGIFRGSCLR